MNNMEHFKKIATELGELYKVKDRAYGSSFADTYKKLGIISAVTRISDKCNRLCNLATNPDIDNLGESIEDTLKDMAAYSIMTLMEMRGEEELNRCKPFEEGAKWADEHQNLSEEEQVGMGELGMEWQKKHLIDKACEWLTQQEEMIGVSFEEDFIERFKKAMEL